MRERTGGEAHTSVNPFKGTSLANQLKQTGVGVERRITGQCSGLHFGGRYEGKFML